VILFLVESVRIDFMEVLDLIILNLLRFAGKTIGVLEGLQESDVIADLSDAVFI